MQAPSNSPASPATSASGPTTAELQEHTLPDLSSPQEQIQTEKQFINDAAHQLRTPLAGIISQAELALQETDLQQLHQRIKKIHTAAQRGAQLVRQMLALARSEARASHDISPETYDLAELAREVAREWIPKSLKLNKDLGYEGLQTAHVYGNRFMMREAISNLIDNALSYTPANAVITVRVSRAHGASPATLLLEVADNGPGVSAEQLPHVFERFWRADDETTRGSGLGLALVARVAEQHGGTATAHHAEPHGFVIRLCVPESAMKTPS